MKRTILFCDEPNGFAGVNMLLEGGWVLDPEFGGRPLALFGAVVYHLVRYEEGEEPKMEAKPGEFDDVIGIKDVAPNDADGWLAQGYRVQAVYQKNIILFKRQPKEAA